MDPKDTVDILDLANTQEQVIFRGCEKAFRLTFSCRASGFQVRYCVKEEKKGIWTFNGSKRLVNNFNERKLEESVSGEFESGSALCHMHYHISVEK